MPKVAVGPVDLYYHTIGRGEPVLFVPGLAADHTIWANQVAALSKCFTVIAYDPRDVGRSSASPTHYTVDTLAEDAASLLEKLGLAPAHIVGGSLGGSTAQELAITRPELVRRLALVSSTARVGRRLVELIETWKVLRVKLTLEEFYRAMYLWLFMADYYDRHDVARLVRKVLSTSHPQSVEGFLRQAEAGKSHDAGLRLHQISAPTLVVVGAEDCVTPPSCARRLADAIPNAGLTIVERAGHGLALERPQELNRVLIEFLTA